MDTKLIEAIQHPEATMSYIATLYEDSPKVNDAIIARWGESGLRFIRREAYVFAAWRNK